MIRSLPLVLALALGACAPMLPYLDGGPIAEGATVAPPPVASPRERLVTAIEEHGCLLTADNATSIQLRANLSRDELTAIMQQLREDRQVEIPGLRHDPASFAELHLTFTSRPPARVPDPGPF